MVKKALVAEGHNYVHVVVTFCTVNFYYFQKYCSPLRWGLKVVSLDSDPILDPL